eukprot:scaffold15080_cov135-Isochrysis_galbana.AAC.2
MGTSICCSVSRPARAVAAAVRRALVSRCDTKARKRLTSKALAGKHASGPKSKSSRSARRALPRALPLVCGSIVVWWGPVGSPGKHSPLPP